MAGTDYDFEDEFDDDFGESKEPEVTLNDLRAQSKKQTIPIYMQNKNKKQQKDAFDDFGFDEPPEITKPARSAKKGRGGVTNTNNNRGRGRGRPKRGQRAAPATFDFDDDADGDVDEEIEIKKVEEPKLPKLKLGAMLASKKQVEKTRRESNDSVESSAAVKVPKLKIKLGPKPESKPELLEENDSKSDHVVKNKNEQPLEISRKEDVLLETEKEAKEIVNSNEISKPSPASSPTKKGSRLDSIAERLFKGANMTKSTSGTNSNELESIFGPSGVPLDMTNSGDNNKEAKTTSRDEVPTSEAKSELDLIREEIEGGSVASAASVVVAAVAAASAASKTPSFIQSSPAGASPHADTVYGPLKKAINASKSAMEREAQNKIIPAASTTSEVDQNYEVARKHLKFKFKVDDRHTTSSTPPPPSINPPPSVTSSSTSMIPPSTSSVAQSVTSMAAASASMASSYKRMNRKKELLNQYYGQDIYSAPTNGPTSQSTSSTSSSNQQPSMPTSYDQLSSYARSSEPQPPRPVIKMPKAVASVTSVPTRADYQQQLEANLERKRKREKGDLGLKNDAMSSDKGKKKRGRGGKNADDDDYRPKIASNNLSASGGQSGTSSNSLNDKMRKTRGKPPKKCLADSPEHGHEPGDLKAESMKFAEAIRAQFDNPNIAPTTSKKGGKKKRKGGPLSGDSNNKTPRLVIKFSKDSTISRENGGRDEYDFDEDADKVPVVDGTVDSAISSIHNSPGEPRVHLTKLKIKI